MFLFFFFPKLCLYMFNQHQRSFWTGGRRLDNFPMSKNAPLPIYAFYRKSEVWEAVKGLPQNLFQIKKCIKKQSRVFCFSICRSAIKCSHRNHIFVCKCSEHCKECLKDKINSNGEFQINQNMHIDQKLLFHSLLLFSSFAEHFYFNLWSIVWFHK